MANSPFGLSVYLCISVIEELEGFGRKDLKLLVFVVLVVVLSFKIIAFPPTSYIVGTDF